MAKDDNVKFRKSVDWKTSNKPINRLKKQLCTENRKIKVR